LQAATIGDKIVETLYSNRVTSENKRILILKLVKHKNPVLGEVSQLILSPIVDKRRGSTVVLDQQHHLPSFHKSP